MAKELTQSELKKLISDSTNELKKFVDELQQDTVDKTNPKRAMLLAHWIIDYIKMLREEKTFNPSELIKYERGDILLVNFGFRIGSELGGRHFAMVLDKYNSKKSPVVTVAPFRSLKENYNKNQFSHILEKGIHDLQTEKLKKITDNFQRSLEELVLSMGDQNLTEEDVEIYTKKLGPLKRQLKEATNLRKDLMHLKKGSVIDLGQIITISKQRILNPKYPSDTLSKIKVIPSDLDTINQKISYLYINKSKISENIC